MDAKIEVGQRWRCKTRPDCIAKVLKIRSGGISVRREQALVGDGYTTRILTEDLLKYWEPCDAPT
jgi:hypothetical protein